MWGSRLLAFKESNIATPVGLDALCCGNPCLGGCPAVGLLEPLSCLLPLPHPVLASLVWLPPSPLRMAALWDPCGLDSCFPLCGLQGRAADIQSNQFCQEMVTKSLFLSRAQSPGSGWKDSSPTTSLSLRLPPRCPPFGQQHLPALGALGQRHQPGRLQPEAGRQRHSPAVLLGLQR